MQTRACSHTCSAKEEGRRGDEDRVRKNAVGESNWERRAYFYHDNGQFANWYEIGSYDEKLLESVFLFF